MIAAITSAFADRLQERECLTPHAHPRFVVRDPPSPSPEPCVVVAAAPRTRADFEVINPQQRQIHLVAIDKCLYAYGGPETRCDCALLANGQLHFIEFKDVHSESRSGNASDCLDQLAASIDDFYSRQIIPAGATVYAFASVGHTRTLPYNGGRLRELREIFNRKVTTKAIRLRLVVASELVVD